MANDGKLYIIITDKREGEEGPVSPTPSQPEKKESKKSAQSIITHQFYSFVLSQAKQFVNYQISNIGNFTGDYEAQRRVSEAIQYANIGLNIGGAFVAGTMMGGPVVGAVAAAITTAGVAINAVYESHTQRIQNAKVNYNIDQLRKRSGLNANRDGSRGTEN